MIPSEELANLVMFFPAVRALPQERVERLANDVSLLSAGAGTALFDVGSPCEGFAMLTRGTIRVFRRVQPQRTLVLYRVEPGACCVLSASCLLSGASYPAAGVAQSDVAGAWIPKPVFLDLVDESPPFRSFIFQSFASRFVEMMTLVEEAGFRRLDQRLAALLLGRGPVIEITHQALAEEIGTAREVVSRVLEEFELRGLVRLGRKSIEVVGDTELQCMARRE